MKSLILFFLFILSTVSFSQEDSLHLVFTITGENTEEPIYFCKALGDINHDGFDDFVIRRESVNYCEIYFGGKKPDLSNPLKLYDQPNINMGILFNIGDINGDGFDDYAESGSLNNGGFPSGVVYVFYGSTEFDTIPDWSIRTSCIDGLLGSSGSSGDINGDKIDDLILGEPYNWCDEIGRAYLFYGGDSLSDSPDLTFESGSPEDFFGDNVSANGDINGDGFDDLIILAPNLNGDPNLISKVYIYFGKSIISIQPDLIINSSFNYLPLSTFYLPDFNGDGFSDFFIIAENKIYFGSSDFDGNDTLKFVSNEQYDNFGETAGYAGDINNDGFSDLILGATGHKNAEGVMVGGAYVYLGSSNPDTTADYFLEGETKWSTFGFNCGTLGDINGDGYDEFFIIAPNYPDTTYGDDDVLGKIYVYSMKKFLVGVNENTEQTPQNYNLEQNYPNPFSKGAGGNPKTTIKYSIPFVIARSGEAATWQSPVNVTLTVYDILGRKVATLVNERKTPGNYSVKFNAFNLPSGIYFYTLRAGNFSTTKKMILMK